MSLKVPLIAVPEPTLLLEKLDPENENAVLNSYAQNDEKNTEVKLSFRHNYAVIKIDCAQKWHSGKFCTYILYFESAGKKFAYQ